LSAWTRGPDGPWTRFVFLFTINAIRSGQSSAYSTSRPYLHRSGNGQIGQRENVL